LFSRDVGNLEVWSQVKIHLESDDNRIIVT